MRLTPTNYRSASGRPLTDFDALFRSAFHGLSDFGRILDPEALLGRRSDALPVDIFEDGDRYVARIEVPGIKREAIEIGLEGRVLTVSVSRTDSEGAETTSSRRLSVPESVNGEGVTARLVDGVLHLELPKSEESKPRTIEIA